MTFTNDKAIYIQMADRLCDEILSGVYKDDDRIPSVREYAVLLEVNTNTAVKAYEQLAREEIIYNKRGLGYFVTPGARKQTYRMLKFSHTSIHSSQMYAVHPIYLEGNATFRTFATSNEQN